jgi:diguanylate cyclase (GGDEF)-like protein
MPPKQAFDRRTVALMLAGLVISLGTCAWYASLTWNTVQDNHTALTLATTFTQDALRADISCQRYLATGDPKPLERSRNALKHARQTAGKLSGATGKLFLGDAILAPAIVKALQDLDAWEGSFAVPAIAMKREGRSQNLSEFNRKRASSVLSLKLRDSLEEVCNRAESAIAQNSSRATERGRIALGMLTAGLAILIAAMVMFYRQGQAILADMRIRGNALELLSHWAERIQRIFSEDQVAQTLADTLTVRMGLARATVMLKTPGEGAMKISVDLSTDGKPASPAPGAHEIEDCPATRDSQRMLVIQGERDRACNCALAAASQGGYVCIPVTAGGSVVGVVRAESPGGKPLNRAAIEQIESLVRMTSITLNTFLSLAEAKQQATTDGLTEVFNRRFLDAFLHKQIHVANRSRQKLAVLMMDLDHFKDFNDKYGHAAGDALLRSFAKIVSRVVRDGDLLARYGGEEFAAVLPNTEHDEAMEIAERVRESAHTVRLDILPNLPAPVMTVSLGVACLPDNGTTDVSLMQSADAALYRAKESGRDRVISA